MYIQDALYYMKHLIYALQIKCFTNKVFFHGKLRNINCFLTWTTESASQYQYFIFCSSSYLRYILKTPVRQKKHDLCRFFNEPCKCLTVNIQA